MFISTLHKVVEKEREGKIAFGGPSRKRKAFFPKSGELGTGPIGCAVIHIPAFLMTLVCNEEFF
jgi:hypothetical protein